MAEFDAEDVEGRASDAAGSPEGDGDFETDNLPATGDTSAGGQVGPPHDTRGGVQGREPEQPSLLKKAMDQVATGKILP